MSRWSRVRKLVFSCLLSTLVATAWVSSARADVPPVLVHQGRLFDGTGQPVTSAAIQVQFAIYSTPNAASPVWMEIDSVAFEDGYFSVELGQDPMNPIDSTVFSGEPRYLGISVGNDAEMTPRSLVGSVPYALVAQEVNGDIHPTKVTVSGSQVIDSAGLQLSGAAPAVVDPAATVTSSGTSVVGSSTNFTTQFKPGDEIIVANQGQIVASVVSDTSLTTVSPFSPPANGSSFKVRRPIARFVSSSGITTFIANSQGNIGVGTSTPGATVDVAGTVAAQNFLGRFNGVRFDSGTVSFPVNTCNTVAAPCVINLSGFSSPPVCTISMNNGDATGYTERMAIKGVTTTQLLIWKGVFPDAGTTMVVSYICVGP